MTRNVLFIATHTLEMPRFNLVSSDWMLEHV